MITGSSNRGGETGMEEQENRNRRIGTGEEEQGRRNRGGERGEEEEGRIQENARAINFFHLICK